MYIPIWNIILFGTLMYYAGVRAGERKQAKI